MGVDRVSHRTVRRDVMDVVYAVLRSKRTVQETRSVKINALERKIIGGLVC